MFLGAYFCLIMAWVVIFHEAFDAEFAEFPRAVRTALAAKARLLETFEPMLGRSHVDTLKGSKHSNVKELRLEAEDGVWRAAFAFDTARQAVILVAGDKSGTSEGRFTAR